MRQSPRFNDAFRRGSPFSHRREIPLLGVGSARYVPILLSCELPELQSRKVFLSFLCRERCPLASMMLGMPPMSPNPGLFEKKIGCQRHLPFVRLGQFVLFAPPEPRQR